MDSWLTGFDVSTGQFTHWSEMNSDEFTETGRVVITDSLSVTKSFEDWIGLHDLILQITLNSDVFQKIVLIHEK